MNSSGIFSIRRVPSSPAYTIGSSRREARAESQSADRIYDIPISTIRKDIGHKISTTREREERPLTADIDFIAPPQFSASTPIKIGARSSIPVFQINNNPGPYFVKEQNERKIYHKIQNRTPLTERSLTPPPGAYNPRDASIPRAPAYSFSPLFSKRARPEDITPGPGQYYPKYSSSAPSFSIGRRRRSASPDKRTIMVDRFMVRIDKSIPDVERYINGHPELRKIVGEIMNRILEEKPDVPLSMLREMFNTAA